MVTTAGSLSVAVILNPNRFIDFLVTTSLEIGLQHFSRALLERCESVGPSYRSTVGHALGMGIERHTLQCEVATCDWMLELVTFDTPAHAATVKGHRKSLLVGNT